MSRLRIAPLLVATALLGCRSPQHEYPAEVVRNFLDRCGAQAPRAVCECSLDAIRARFTYDQFVALEQSTRATGTPAPEFQAIATECR